MILFVMPVEEINAVYVWLIGLHNLRYVPIATDFAIATPPATVKEPPL